MVAKWFSCLVRRFSEGGGCACCDRSRNDGIMKGCDSVVSREIVKLTQHSMFKSQIIGEWVSMQPPPRSANHVFLLCGVDLQQVPAMRRSRGCQRGSVKQAPTATGTWRAEARGDEAEPRTAHCRPRQATMRPLGGSQSREGMTRITPADPCSWQQSREAKPKLCLSCGLIGSRSPSACVEADAPSHTARRTRSSGGTSSPRSLPNVRDEANCQVWARAES